MARRAATLVTLPGSRADLRAVAVGPRQDGRPHDPGELAELERVGILAARAVRGGRTSH
jgi:hypothetical protein